MKKYYITTTLPYVNAEPHIGFAAEIIRADVLARWQRQIGNEVFFNTGTDEHGLKIYRKSKERGMDAQEYCDEYAAKFENLKNALNLTYDSFVRTTDEHHQKAAQEFWNLCQKNGDIYKKNYQVKYCVGCELEKTESELIDGRCPLHPNQELELIDEENYFFRFSKYQDKLLKFYQKNSDFVAPAHRLKEITEFVKRGLKDFSISRLKKKMPWGVAVPGDEEQVMYVWFDALVNYIDALDWPEDNRKFKNFWPGIQVAGKDNLRQQTAMWQAMLMSAGLPNSRQVLIFGFITSGGQKMSKSLGNVVNPLELVEKYGTDATRYFLLSELQPFEDSDFTIAKFEEKYNADLANGLGNLTARVSNLLEKNNIELKLKIGNDKELKKRFTKLIEEYQFNECLKILWDKIRECDEFLSAKTPWKLTEQKEIKKILEPVARNILNIAELLQPFLPATAEKIIMQFSAQQIKKGESLFPRL
ncbi:MAG: methionine--tRNA ligase [Patescibacteria group bacterium]|nr:methionine--tRNA ligase [Patescibacteria group bacterium]MDD4611301.1 methionine--tRNA ligase [Patescibacteria group bacterium]